MPNPDQSTNPSEKSLVYEVPEAGAMLGLTRNASYEAAKRGDIPIIRIGKLLRVPKEAFHRMLEQAGAK
jgi:excisionase family DNA binding protein